MKRTALVLILVAVAAAMGFAGGAQEQGDADGVAPAPAEAETGTGAQAEARPEARVRVPFQARVRTPAEVEETTVTGTYDEADGYPVLRVDGEIYSVGVPGYHRFDVNLEPGDEVTASGYLFEESADIAGHLRVTGARLNGTDYEFEAPPAGHGRHGGRPHGRGPAGYYGEGPRSYEGPTQDPRSRSPRSRQRSYRPHW
ncbi:MAG: hypothetical protein ACOCXE_05605 [Spirochaetota bacterium]